MVMFITGVLWFTGKGGSPLFNLYLLPIILSALTLGRAGDAAAGGGHCRLPFPARRAPRRASM